MKELLLTPQKLDSILSREKIRLRGIPSKTKSRQDPGYWSWIFDTELMAIQLLQHAETSSIVHCTIAIVTSMPEKQVTRAIVLANLLTLEAVPTSKIAKAGQVFSKVLSECGQLAISQGDVGEQIDEVPKTIQLRAKLYRELGAGMFLLGFSKLPLSKEELALITAPEMPVPASSPSLAACRN